MRYRTEIIIIFSALVLLFVGTPIIRNNTNLLASLFLPDSITSEGLQEKYLNKKLKILIVPGHDNESWGTEFRNVREVDLNLEIAEILFQSFDEDSHFQAFLTQDKNGYLPVFADYFVSQRSVIEKFKDYVWQFMDKAKQDGFDKKTTVYHNTASKDTIIKLYGINKWANDNDIDIVLHIHFNDYAGRRYGQIGEYSGFSIYVPEEQLPNSRASRDLASSIFDRLNKILTVSDLPKEDVGIVEDQELIAIGANASLNATAFLIEYGYIYESQFRDKKMKEFLFPEIAYQTYSGVKRFFEPDYKINKYDSKLLPYYWNKDLSVGMKNNLEVALLQRVLTLEDVYDGPITGNFYDLTRQGVIDFQTKHNFTVAPNTGYVGSHTRKILNELFSK